MTDKIVDWYFRSFSMNVDDFYDGTVEKYGLRHVVPLVAVSFYLFVIFMMPKLLPPRGKANKPPKSLRYICFVWNIMLSSFSIVSLVMVGIPQFFLIKKHGPLNFLCDEKGSIVGYQRHPLHFWYLLFLLSKFVELGDTFFLILKKPERRPTFLHIYHHLTVMLSCWYLAITNVSVAHYGIPVNLFIHSIMYFYYAMYEIGFPQKWGFFLTMAQMVQMFGGILAYVFYCWEKYHKGRDCCGKKYMKEVIMVGVVMYTTYLYLFLRFFIRRYFGKKGKEKKEN